jgi:hypothetical protein
VKIELLYLPGCPNYQPALERIRKVLMSESLHAEIESIAVRSEALANNLQFAGSPTIRVNGQDVEPGLTKAVGLTCRLYANSGGAPSEETLRLALSRADQKESI